MARTVDDEMAPARAAPVDLPFDNFFRVEPDFLRLGMNRIVDIQAIANRPKVV